MSVGSGEYTPEKIAELKRNAVTYKPKSDATANDNPFGVDPELPTPEQIHAARERRAKMREGGGSTAKDFIPLNEGKGDGRLVREDGDDDDEDEEGRDGNSRIDFNSVKEKGERGKAYIDGAIDIDAQDEDDEEMKRWEMDRITKGVGAQEMKRKDLVEKAKKPATSSQGQSSQNIHVDLTRDKPTITLESITKDINVTLAGLQSAHKSHVAQLERINEELERASTQTAALQEEAKSGADEYSFFAGMKDYVADLLDCLGAKAEFVENAEDKLIAAHRVHGARNRTYAQNKIDEKTAEMKTIVEEAAGYSNPQAQAKDLVKKERKKRARGDEEGWSSDEESKEVNNDFETAKEDARDEGRAVFADVNEDYSSIATIKGKFEKWKNQYPTSYKQAYISLSMPQLFAPFVSLQLLDRDLLAKDSLDSMGWYNDLFEYGRGEGGLDDPDDEDNFLVPKLIEKVVVPRLVDGLTHEWNVQSKRGNTLALRRVKEALDYAESQEADHVKELVSCVYGGLQQAVSEVSIPIFSFPKQENERDREPWEFSCRILWRSIKLLRNIAAWHEVIAARPLQQLIIDNLLTQKLLPFLRSIRESHPSLFLDAYESILDSIPPSWLINEGGGGKGVSPAFGLFHDQVMRVAKQLEKEKKDKEREAQLERAVRILYRLHDQDTVRAIAKSNSIKL